MTTMEARIEQDGAGDDPVCFYSERHEWGVFSNFSRHAVTMLSPWTLQPVTYETSEHRFQAMKACTQEDHDLIAECKGPGTAKQLGRQINLRDDWGNTMGAMCWWVMIDVLYAKAAQHNAMANALKDTLGRFIYEDSPTDGIWGWVQMDYRSRSVSYEGQNLLGLALMHVRTSLF